MSLAWVHIISGQVMLNSQLLNAGDAAAVSGEQLISVSSNAAEPSEVLLFDLA
jgi:redox-sensitive bicupin YhaK (pirin superfamily)